MEKLGCVLCREIAFFKFEKKKIASATVWGAAFWLIAEDRENSGKPETKQNVRRTQHGVID